MIQVKNLPPTSDNQLLPRQVPSRQADVRNEGEVHKIWWRISATVLELSEYKKRKASSSTHLLTASGRGLAVQGR